jgi:ribosome-associated toxin RatA of RatAB toxin-antitoxin module
MNTVIATRNVSADPKTVWALISDVTTVVDFHPAVKSVDLLSDSPTGLGASRRCNFYDDTSVVETVTEVEEGRSVTLDLTEFSVPMKRFGASISVTPLAGSGTQVTFTLNYEMKFGVLGQLMNVAMVRGQMNKLMTRVLAGIDHHLTTGELVGEDFVAQAA